VRELKLGGRRVLGCSKKEARGRLEVEGGSDARDPAGGDRERGRGGMGRVGLVGPTGPRREKKRGREKEVGWAGKEERKGSKFCFVVFFLNII